MEKPSPIAALLASRKAALFAFASVLVLFMALSLEVAIVVASIRGKLTLEAAIGLSFGPLTTGALGVVALAAKVIDAIAKEDAASKGAGVPATALLETTKETSAPSLPPLPLLMLCLVLGAVGCATSFEESRWVGLKPSATKTAARSPDLEQYCRELDDRRIKAGALAKGAGVVAGVAGAGAGISGALVDAPRGVALGAAGLGVAAGAVAAYEVVSAEGYGAAWARSCAP